jgi:hypothetical protein
MRKGINLLEGSQASPARPSDDSEANLKTLGQLEAAAWERGCGILIFWINVEM